MESVVSILQIFQFIGAPIGKWWKYFKGVDENMKILKRNLEELKCKKEDIQLRLSADQSGKKLAKKEVELWLKNVQIIITDTQNIEKMVGETRYLLRARFRKRVDEKIKEVSEYLEKGSFSDGLVVDAPQSSGVTLSTPPLVGETTAKKYMNEIMKYLMGDKIRKIGVCGMGGVGKTTIMKHVNNQLMTEKKNFDDVIWVTASRELNVTKLQNDIAQSLNKKLLEDDKTKRAGELLKMLEQKKRYVLILDDLWDTFRLEEVGIPEPTITNGCKLVLTTRSIKVCRSMDCKEVKVEPLTKDEAWKLFSDKVGHDVLNIPILISTVELVAEECAGLPLAIVTIASSMKGVDDIREWRNALKELRGCVKGVTGMESEVFGRLKFSYDHLKDPNVQLCFLYCALYPEDSEIEKGQLIEYWIVEGLVDEMPSRKEEYDRGHAILNILENSCLLEKTHQRRVKMHDLVRDMAISITRESPRFMVKAGMKLIEFPKEEEWMEDLEKVSLMMNSISEIPSDMSPKCQRLHTLFLQGNRYLKSVSSSFFVHMLGLKVLDLSSTGIEILPDSISNLEHLTALLLRRCYSLRHVPSLAALKALRKLDLVESGIEEVPQGMEKLVYLRCLNLGGRYLKMLPTGILPKFSRIQCLIVERGRSETLINVKAEEVGSLTKLETFVGNFCDLDDFNVYARRMLQGQGPHKYLLQVGSYGALEANFDEDNGLFSTGRSKSVGLRRCKVSSRIGENALVLPNDIDYLRIEECHDVSDLSHVVSSLNTADFLKECDIISCDGIECVLSTTLSSSSSSQTPLQSLEVLFLSCLQNLHVLIFRGEGDSSPPPPLPLGTFSNLKTLSILNCPNIKKLFTLELLPHFQNLEKLFVSRCNQMEEIIAAKAQGEEEEQRQQGKMCGSSNHSTVNHDGDNDAVFTITLPKLADLTLMYLPKLKSIVSGRGVMICDSLRKISLPGCPKLKRLPLSLPMLNGQPSPPPSLQRIRIDRVCWETLEWDHPTAKDILQSFVSYTQIRRNLFYEMASHCIRHPTAQAS